MQKSLLVVSLLGGLSLSSTCYAEFATGSICSDGVVYIGPLGGPTTPSEGGVTAQPTISCYYGTFWVDYGGYIDGTGSGSTNFDNIGGSGGGSRGGREVAPTIKPAKVDPCATASGNEAGNEHGNPIRFSTGQKIERETDFIGEGQVPLSLTRDYDSQRPLDGLFGRYWQSNFDYRLQISTDGIFLTYPGRGYFKFNWDPADNTWRAVANGVNAFIRKETDGSYTLNWVNDSTQRYDAGGKPIAIRDTHSVGIDFTYDGSGRLYRVTATTGRYVQFGWTGTQLTQVTDPAGNLYSYTYTANKFGTDLHRLASTTFPGGIASALTYHYEKTGFSGALTGKSINGVRFSTFSYDANGWAVSTEHQGIEKYTFSYTYPSAGVMQVTETNPLGKQAAYKYVDGELDSIVGLPSVSCPASLYTRTKDVNGFTDKITDFNGNVTDWDYNAAGQPIQEIHGAGFPGQKIVTYQWDASGRIQSRRVDGDSEVRYTYTSDGRIASESTKNLSATGTASQTLVTTYSYTTQANGLIASMTIDGPLPGVGDAITRTYSATGDLITVSSSLGTLLSYAGYNNLGLPASVLDINGVRTGFTYDARGRVIATNRTAVGLNSTSAVTFDGRGRVIAVSSPDGTTQLRALDAANRLTSITQPESITDPDPGNTTETLEKKWLFSYNLNSELTQSTINRKYTFSFYDPDLRKVVNGGSTTGNVTAFADYDELGRVKALKGNGGQNSRYGYDESGLLTSITDSLGRTTALARDSQNRLATITDPKGGITRITYNSGDRRASVTDPRGLVTRYSYDGLGRLWRVESPDTGVWTYSYDGYGRLISETRPDLTLATVGYDSLGRKVSLQVGAALQTFSYDSCSNGKGRLCSTSDASGSTQWAYTPTGQVAQQQDSIAGVVYTTAYQYDNTDRLVGIVFPDGKAASYTYLDGRIFNVSVVPNGVSQPLAAGITYQPFGAFASLGYGNGLARNANYDGDGRLASSLTKDYATNTTIQSLNYTWNANDQVTLIANARSSALTQSYVYDELGRLTGAGRGDGVAEGFGYDGDGNRTSYTKSGASTGLVYAVGSNRLVSSDGPGVHRVWTYDSNGSTNGFTGPDGLAIGLHSDGFGRIDSSSRAGQPTAYQVNGLGQRLSKSGPNGNSRFIYSPDGGLLAEYKLGMGWTDYVRANGEVLGFIRNNAVFYVHNDRLGRPEIVTNSSKSIVWSAANYAFDRTLTTDSIGGLNIGLPGQYFDQETGTWYNMFRDYDASTGRYLQSDPLGLNGGLNTYAYVGGNPVNSIDPFGLYCLNKTTINAIGGAVGGAVGGGLIGGPAGLAIGAVAGGVGGAIAGSIADAHGTASGAAYGGMVGGIVEGGVGGLRDGPGGMIGGAVSGGLGGVSGGALSGPNAVSSAAGGALGGAIGGNMMGVATFGAATGGAGAAWGGLVGLASGLAAGLVIDALEANNDCGCAH